MHLSAAFVYALSAASFALGAAPFTREACATTWGPNSVRNVPSLTQTNKIFKTEVVKIHKCTTTKVKTVTPKPTTSTSTIWKTVTKNVTNKRLTATAKVTKTNTSTKWKTEKVTEVSTKTTSALVTTGTTTTIPTPAGFTAVADSPDYRLRRKRSAADFRKSTEFKNNQGLQGFTPWTKSLLETRSNSKSNVNKHAQRVICTKWITSTATTTTTSCTRTPTRTTTIRRATASARVTKTTTTTRTINPAKTTTTVTVQKQTTITKGRLQTIQEQETKTLTSTTGVAIATAYAACASNNVVDKANGLPIGFISTFTNTKWSLADGVVDNPVKCCEACFGMDDCLGTFYYQTYCMVGTSREARTCQAGGGLDPDAVYSGYDNDFNGTISNGPCGRFKWTSLS